VGLLAGDCQDDRGGNAAYVTRLVSVLGSQSPAQLAGVQVGDRLVRLDACDVASTSELVARLRSAPPGWVARVVVEREGREMELFVPTVKLPDRSDPPSAPRLSTAGCQAIGRKAAR
jgi:S1-C subfamily serine protease